jgi:hypothetical protein
MLAASTPVVRYDKANFAFRFVMLWYWALRGEVGGFREITQTAHTDSQIANSRLD